MNVRAMTLADLPEVVGIHRERFPESRSTSLGDRYLAKMYRWFLENYPGLALVATVDDRVVGFATGSIGGYGRRVFRYTLPEIALGLLGRPQLLLRSATYTLWSSFLRGLAPRANRPQTAPDGRVRGAFASIAVARSSEGAGIPLILAFETAMKKAGAHEITHTVKAANETAVRLYEALGWQARHDRADAVRFRKQIA
jgi:ribosomal protein S18 acetylase RimI-like enzyme